VKRQVLHLRRLQPGAVDRGERQGEQGNQEQVVPRLGGDRRSERQQQAVAPGAKAEVGPQMLADREAELERLAGSRDHRVRGECHNSGERDRGQRRELDGPPPVAPGSSASSVNPAAAKVSPSWPTLKAIESGARRPMTSATIEVAACTTSASGRPNASIIANENVVENVSRPWRPCT
jgi:hypothetical protein